VDNNLSKAKEIFSSINDQDGIMYCEILRTDMEFREGKTTLAKVKFLHNCHSAWGKQHQSVAFCLERLANVKAWPSVELQFIWPMIYLGYAQKTKEKLAFYKALLFLGDVFLSHEDGDTTQNLWIVALEGFTHMDIHCSRAQCMLQLGDLAMKRGEISTAIEFWKSARPLFERSLQAKDVVQIDVRLTAAEDASQEALAKIAELHPPAQLLDQLSIFNEATSSVEAAEEEDKIGTDVAEAIVPVAA
jgi:hypothetical protein